MTSSHHGRRSIPALILGAALAGCGGGPGTSDFVESLVRLLSARFVPASVTVPRGSPRSVDFEVVCDKAGLDTPFGRLGVRVKLDPDRRLPAGFSATVVGRTFDNSGFAVVPCTGTHSDPNLRIAHVEVQVLAAASVPVTSATLVGYVEVEPLVTGDPSKDSTLAELTVTVAAGEPTNPTN